MARKERLFLAGLPQLIELKGHNHQEVFYTPADYHYFLQCLDKALTRYGGDLHGYSLEKEQILLLLTPRSKESLGRLIQHIGRCYVPYFNHAHSRTGALWDGRYKSCHVEPGSYFLLCLQYIDTHAKVIAPSPEKRDHSWCSHKHDVGHDFQPRIKEHKQYRLLGSTPKTRASAYSNFISTPLSNNVIERIEDSLHQNCVLGTPQYCQSVEQQIHRNVRPRRRGRPRKHFDNPVQQWVWLESQARKLFKRYSYQEIRLSMLEADEQVEKLDNFTQGNVEAIRASHDTVLRYEGTLSCLRAVAQNKELLDRGRLWYQGSVFSHKDNVVQLRQIGAEAFGCEGVEIVLEQLLLQHDFFTMLNMRDEVSLRINYLGEWEEFCIFRKALRHYFGPYKLVMDEQSLEWLEETPERILHEHPSLLNMLVAEAPRLHQFQSYESKQRFARLTQALKKLDVEFEIQLELFPERNYSHTIFEWHSEKLGRDSLICRGGRYDVLANKYIKETAYACGFAFQLESLMKLIHILSEDNWRNESQDVVVIPRTSFDRAFAMGIAQKLRQTFPNSRVTNDCSHNLAEKSKLQALKKGNQFVMVVDKKASNPIELFSANESPNEGLQVGDAIQALMRHIPMQG